MGEAKNGHRDIVDEFTILAFACRTSEWQNVCHYFAIVNKFILQLDTINK